MVKIKSLIVASLVVLLVGCGTNPPQPTPEAKVEIVKVEVPVYVKRDPPPSRELPKLGLKLINKSSSPRDTALAYDKAIQDLSTEILWYRSILYEESKE